MVAESAAELGDLVVPPSLGILLGCAGGAFLWMWTGNGSWTSMLAFALFGWLYALCQHRTNWLGFLLVGVSYGITLWILTHLTSKLHTPQHWPLFSEGHGHLGRCLLFTELLALGGLLVSQLRTPSKPTVLPKD